MVGACQSQPCRFVCADFVLGSMRLQAEILDRAGAVEVLAIGVEGDAVFDGSSLFSL